MIFRLQTEDFRIKWLDFQRWRRQVPDWEYLRARMWVAAAPTIAGLKPATLFHGTGSQPDLRALWKLQPFQGGMIKAPQVKTVCRDCPGDGQTLFIYRRDLLEYRLIQPEIRLFLSGLGLAELSVATALQRLYAKETFSFPHEIGIYLGYPLADVIGFVENKGRNYQLNGYWKVYANVDAARKQFLLFENAQRTMVEFFIRKWH